MGKWQKSLTGVGGHGVSSALFSGRGKGVSLNLVKSFFNVSLLFLAPIYVICLKKRFQAKSPRAWFYGRTNCEEQWCFAPWVNYWARPLHRPPPSLPPNLLWTITTHFLLETQTKWIVFCNRQQERLLHIHLWSNLLRILLKNFNFSLNRGCLCHFPRTSIRAVLAQIRSLVAPFVLHTGLKLGKAGNSQKPETTRLGDKSLSLTQQILIAECMYK